jgi:hypothetical protein
MMAASMDVVFLLEGIIVDFLFRYTRRKPKLRSAEAGDDGVSVASLLWASSWRVSFGGCA